MVAFVHNHHRIEKTNYLNQRCFIGVRQQNGRVIHPFCKFSEIAILLIGFPAIFFAGAERIITEHKHRKLFGYHRRAEILSHQRLLFGVYLYTSAKIHIQSLAVRMVGIV